MGLGRIPGASSFMTRLRRRLSRHVTPVLRRLRLQARSGAAMPGGVGPLLVVGPFEWFVASPYRTYVRMIETVLQGVQFHLVDTSRRSGEAIDLARISARAFGRQADPIVFFLTGPWLGNAGNRLVNHQGLRKLLDIEDQNVNKQLNVILRPHGFQGVLYRYQGEEMDNLRALTVPLGVQHYYWPHHVDSSEHRDWELPKVHDVCLYGAINAGTYPLRARVHELLTRHPGRLRVRIVHYDEGIMGRRLSRVINQSWLTFADTTGASDRFLARFVEIPMSGSCIVGNVPTRHRDLFVGRVIELDLGMSDQSIMDAIQGALANRDRVLEMTRSLRADVLQRYTLARGRETFWAILRDFAAAGTASRGSSPTSV